MTKTDAGESGSDERYSEEETVRRREAMLKRMLSTPPKPHKDVSQTERRKALRGRPPKKK